MLLLIDNYDSFVYNLSRYFVELGCSTSVVRNDAINLQQIRELAPQAIVISPGPCTPNEAGISLDVVRHLHGEIPILGVCLGHQAIAQAFGGKIIRAPEAVHGRTSLVIHDSTGIFDRLPSPLRVARYHSLVPDELTLPTELVVTARTTAGLLMAFEHESSPLYGVQFHPESVLTQNGREILANFARIAGIETVANHRTDWKEPTPAADALSGPVLAW